MSPHHDTHTEFSQHGNSIGEGRRLNYLGGRGSTLLRLQTKAAQKSLSNYHAARQDATYVVFEEHKNIEEQNKQHEKDSNLKRSHLSYIPTD